MMFMKAVAAGRRSYPIVTKDLKLYVDAYNIRSYSGSGSTWTDLSNSGYNLTISGATWTTSGGRRYFELDGVNDYIVGSANTTIFDLVDEWTWSLWVYWVTSPAVYDSIVQSEYASSKLPYFFDNRNTAGTTGAGFGGGMFSTTATGQGDAVNTTITTGVWTHVALTFKRNTATTATMVIYRDATALKTSSLTRSSGDWRDNNISKKPVIGAFLDTGTYSRFNNIRVGEVLNYNRALTSTEISDNYNSTKSNYGL